MVGRDTVSQRGDSMDNFRTLSIEGIAAVTSFVSMLGTPFHSREAQVLETWKTDAREFCCVDVCICG